MCPYLFKPDLCSKGKTGDNEKAWLVEESRFQSDLLNSLSAGEATPSGEECTGCRKEARAAVCLSVVLHNLGVQAKLSSFEAAGLNSCFREEDPSDSEHNSNTGLEQTGQHTSSIPSLWHASAATLLGRGGKGNLFLFPQVIHSGPDEASSS